MQQLTNQAQQKINELAQRYGISYDAVIAMLQSLVNGNGTMAQFNIWELGGSGQWMMGGMTMVGDMFNYSLKSKVDGLCNELSQLLAQNPFIPAPVWNNPPYDAQHQSNFSGSSSYNSGSWWPSDLGSPNGSGSQNNTRYAYFNNTRRLAVESNGNVTIYDTLDNMIGGVSQQQGGNYSLTFSSQYGTFDVSTLPVISINGVAQNVPAPVQNIPWQPQSIPIQSPADNTQEADIFAKIERLADLNCKGIISQEEFATKKAELLARL